VKRSLTIIAWCLGCGRAIPRWRERFVPLRNGVPVLTEAGELALHVEELGACRACGGSTFEVRVSREAAGARADRQVSRGGAGRVKKRV
jgi:hypothetical protein